MDDSDQGMRVSVIQEDGGRVIVDGSTEDADERNVHLDSVELSSSHSYIIKYEFFAKSPVKGNIDEKTIAGSHMGAIACGKPFVVQELVVASKELLRQRAKQHRALLEKEHREEPDVSELPKACDFGMLDNSNVDLERGENGLYCNRKQYHYSLVGESPQELNTIFEKRFKVAGA